jgi:coenzyme F420-reducing hydrogenase delta subunit
MKKYNANSGWFRESARHSLARRGIRTGRRLTDTGLGLSRINYAKTSDVEIEQKMKGLYEDAQKLISSGATPAFHLANAHVSPNVMFYVENKEDYEKYGVTADYPFVQAQVINIPLEQWAKATGVDLDDIRIMYLGINSNVNDMHNASVSLLDADRVEFDEYADAKWKNVSSMDVDTKVLKKGYIDGELSVMGDGDPHADFYHSYGNKTIEDRYKLAKELIDDWKESDMERKGQKKIKDYAKKDWKKIEDIENEIAWDLPNKSRPNSEIPLKRVIVLDNPLSGYDFIVQSKRKESINNFDKKLDAIKYANKYMEEN